MRREGEHINILLPDVDVQVTCRLDGVGVEEHALLTADGAYLAYRHDRAYLVVCIHYGDKAGVVPDSGGDLSGGDCTRFAHGQQLYFKAAALQLFERVQDRVMLKRRGNYVLLAFFCAELRCGDERLIIRLAAA